MASFTLQLFYPQEKDPVPIVQEAGPASGIWCGERIMKLLLVM